MAHSSSKKPHMEAQRALIDKDFDRYVLSSGGIDKQLATLPVRVLEPLAAAHIVRKAQWDARVHYNALIADPFLSDAASGGSAKSVAYFVSAEYELMQVIFSQVGAYSAVDVGHRMRHCANRSFLCLYANTLL